MTYQAFISYSHAVDNRLAPALQSALHRFAKPWYRLRAIHVFRDKTTLAATPALWPSIEQALAESEYFVLLASPEAARSVWVQREITYWLDGRPGDRDKFLVILTGGSLVWDAGVNDFDWNATDALPRIMEKRFSHEPLFLDLRWARTEEQLSLRHPTFRDEIATLSATLHNRPKDEISGEEVRQHRITRRLAWLGVFVLVALTILASGLGYTANVQRREAEQQRTVAEARQWAAQAALANVQQADLLPQSVLLGIEAVRRFPSLETEQGLRERIALLAKPLRELRTDGWVTVLAVSPDGTLVAANGGVAARVWELASGRSDVRLNHDGLVKAVAFSPDGSRLATGSDDRTARIWDLSNGTEVARFTHEAGVGAVLYSPDGRYLVTTIDALSLSNNANCVWRWDLATRQHEGRVCHEALGMIEAVRFASDGRHFATASTDRTVRIWETMTGREAMRFTHDVGIKTIAFNKEGTLLISGSQSGRIRVWDLRTRTERMGSDMSHSAAVNAVSVSPDGKLLVSGSEDHTARVWDLKERREISRILLQKEVVKVSFSPDGRDVLTVDYSQAARVWNAATGEETTRAVHEATVNEALFSPDGRYLVSGSGHTRMTGKEPELIHPAVIAWDRTASRTISKVAHRESIDDIAFSPDGRYLATGSWDHTGKISDPATGEERFRVEHNDRVFSLAFSQDSRWFASGSTGSVHLLDLSNGRERTLSGATGMVGALTFSPDGKQLVAGSTDGTTRAWDLDTGVQRFERRDGDEPVSYVAYSADGRRLLTQHSNHVVSLLNADDGKEWKNIAHAKQVTQTTWSPGGQLFATSEADVVRVWNAADGTPVSTLKHDGYVKGFAWDPDGIRLLAWDNSLLCIYEARDGTLVKQFVRDSTFRARFTPDGRYVIAIGGGHSVHVFEIQSGHEVAQLLHQSELYNVEMSRDGRYIAAIDGRDIVTTWLWRLDDVITEAGHRLMRNFTYEEWQRFFTSESYRKTFDTLPIHDSVILAALKMAREGNQDGFLGLANRIQALEPALDGTRLKAIGQQVAVIGNGERAVRHGEELIRAGKIEAGVASLRAAQTALVSAGQPNRPVDVPTELWNSIAWRGALWGKASDFLYSANRAVETAPSMVELRDTRGVVRALSGEIAGAIEDFEAFVKSGKGGELAARREQWIQVLRRGDNPFTPEELAYLRNE